MEATSGHVTDGPCQCLDIHAHVLVVDLQITRQRLVAVVQEVIVCRLAGVLENLAHNANDPPLNQTFTHHSGLTGEIGQCPRRL